MLPECIYWTILVTTAFIIIIFLFLKSIRFLQSTFFSGLAIYFIICVIIIYAIEQTPHMSHQFHKLPILGAVSFVFKTVLGLCLIIFALTNQKKS